jgi:hypothetical protein
VAIPIKHGNNELELAVDRGEVRAGRRSEPISEIEIEVKDGEPVEAVRFARRIAAETRATYGPKPRPSAVTRSGLVKITGRFLGTRSLFLPP